MTTQRAFPEPDRRASLIAQRVRGLMGEMRISQSALARELGMTQQAFSRRTTGTVEFGVGELEDLAAYFGVDEAYLYGFTNERGPRPVDEGLEVVRHRGLEPRTRWLSVDRNRTQARTGHLRLIPGPLDEPDGEDEAAAEPAAVLEQLAVVLPFYSRRVAS